MLDRPGLKPTFSQFVLTETANKNQKERLLSNDYIWIHFYYLYIRGMIDNTTTYNYKTRHCIAIRKKMRDNCDGGSGNTKFETKMQMLFFNNVCCSSWDFYTDQICLQSRKIALRLGRVGCCH